jgi:hypothetical protein
MFPRVRDLILDIKLSLASATPTKAASVKQAEAFMDLHLIM